MADKTMLIVGAGIAGSTAAHWVARAGWDVTVVEKASGHRSSGNPVDVRGQAAAVTRAMGIWPLLQQADTGTDRLGFVDAGGRRKAVIASRRSSNHVEVEIARSDLSAALLDSARKYARIRFHDTVIGLRQDRDGVEVDFQSAPPQRFDLVVGADGLHSTVRRQAFGPERAYARPFGMFVGTVRAGIPAADPREVLMYNEPGLSLSVHPAGGEPLAAFIFRSRRPYDHRDTEAGARLLEDTYAHVGWIAPRLLDQWRAANDVYFDQVTRVAMPTWTNGRISLLGDAANCLSLLGEGSSNAIVAARTLADAVTAYPDDLQQALAAYEHTHRRRLRRFQRGARIGSHLLVPVTRIGLTVRDAALRLVPGPNDAERATHPKRQLTAGQ